MPRIAIIGLGLIGGSIGLALKRANLSGVEIAGVARSSETAARARKAGAIDLTARSAADAARGAGLVIVASPILTIPGVLEEIAPALEPGSVVTDAASTKALVAQWAKDVLPAHAHFVGGHPMAGKEFQGLDAADADLFKGKPWVIAPDVNAPEAAVNTVIGLVQATGANPIFMDPQEHDSYVAAVSHLPLTVAAALFSVTVDSAAWPELAALASSGFRDTTRLASGSPEMAHDIVQTNRENLLHWIDRFHGELGRFRDIIAKGDSKEIAAAFGRAQLERDNYMINGPPRRESGEPIPKIGLGDFMLGSRVADMMRKQEEIVRAAEARTRKK